jgi:hypothetical protein
MAGQSPIRRTYQRASSILAGLAGYHMQELLTFAPGMVQALQAILNDKELLESFGEEDT